MKLFAFFAAAALAEIEDDTCYSNGEEVSCSNLARTGGRSMAVSTEDSSERRYADLKAIADKVWKLNGLSGKNKFDERKYWAYGCHCYLLGDRPLSEMGTGAPKVSLSQSNLINIINFQDELDNKCKAYKDCQKCVRDKHGDQCIGEFVKYTWKYASKRSQFESVNTEGSCERELFQCDLKFAEDTFAAMNIFSEDYHFFWGGFDNRDPDNCPSNGGIPVDHQCCGGYDREQ